MKKKLIPILSGLVGLTIALVACKPAAQKSENDRPSIAAATKATMTKVKKSVAAVPQNVALFTYYFPTENSINFGAGDGDFYKTTDKFAENKDFSDIFDFLIERMEELDNALFIGSPDVAEPAKIKSLFSSFLKRGNFASFMNDYATFMLDFGFVGYCENIDMGNPAATKFAMQAFLNGKALQDYLNSTAEKTEIDLSECTTEAETKAGKIKCYIINDKSSDLVKIQAVIHIANDSVIVANSVETLVAFIERIEAPKESSILNNPEYKKLFAEMKNPIFGVFTDFKGFKLDPKSIMPFTMADNFLGLKKIESCAIFLEDTAEKNLISGSLMVSASDGALFYDLFKTNLPNNNLLKTSPQNAALAMSFALPTKDNPIYDRIANMAAMTGKNLNENPFFMLIKENLNQINVSLNSLKGLLAVSSPRTPDINVNLDISDLGKVISENPIVSQLVHIEPRNGVEHILLNYQNNEENVILKLDDRTLAFSSYMDAENLTALLKGKSKTMADVEGFKILSKKLGNKNTLEYYFDYMKYLEFMNELIQESPSVAANEASKNFLTSYFETFATSIKDYKVAIGVKSERDIIKINSFVLIDINQEALFNAIEKLDWAFVKKQFEYIKKN